MSAVNDSGFIVNGSTQPEQGEGSSIVLNSAPQPDDPNMRSAKYDLSERVMKPIAKPILPAVPYSGTSDYGIHRVLRVHQKGGMGRILVAYDQYLKREVAIKELHPEVAEDDSIVRRFIGEAEITAQLEHPGVVPIHRLGQGRDGLPYYTMKLIKGETLQDAIKTYHRKPTRHELLNLVRRLVSVSKTIAFAHNKGVIHRDLKPANIMLGEHGETLVMDWGLAKPFNQEHEESYVSIIHRSKQTRPELTMVGAIVGTPAFMSPEQAMAEENVVGPLSDVFSLGAILYYLLAGQTAFSGRSTQEVLSKVRAVSMVPPSEIKPNVPHGLEAICLKAMQKLPKDRYQGAAEFIDDLCRWLDDEPISAEKETMMVKAHRWVMQHKALAVSLPCILFSALVLVYLGVRINQFQSVREQSAVVNSILHEQVDLLEFPEQVAIEGSPGVDVKREPRQTGGLMLLCKVEAMDEKRRGILIHAPVNTAWDLSSRSFLTFSLFESHAESADSLQNFSIRLGRGSSYYEYKPSGELWKNRKRSNWFPFSVVLGPGSADWVRRKIGIPTMEKIEWIEIHFEADSEMTLTLDNITFRKETASK
jgi:serine/threonine protein kinase